MYKILLLNLVLVLTYAQSNSNCRVLGFQSGHDLGAYQAGAFQELVSLLPAGEAEYDVVTGVGVGALNAFWVSLFPKGQEAQAAEFLVSQWKNLQASDLYQSWDENILNVYLKKNSIYNSSNTISFLNTFSNYTVQRNLSFGACDAGNGDYLIFEESLELLDILSGLAGTLAEIPSFQYVSWNNRLLVEGDIVSSLDVATGIEKCQEAGFQDSEIIVDFIFLATSKKFDIVNASNFTAIQTLDRAYQIVTHENGIDVFERLLSDYPDVNYRYKIMPETQLKKASKPYSYSATQISTLMSTGATDAKNTIQASNETSYQFKNIDM